MRVCGGTLFSDGIPGSSVSSDPHSDPHWDTRRRIPVDGSASIGLSVSSGWTLADAGGRPQHELEMR
jgi:hypothetical protein